MTIAVLVCSVSLALASLLIHYEVLRVTSFVLPRLTIPPRQKIVAALCLALVGHLAEIAIYAGGFWVFLEGNVEGLGVEAVIAQAIYVSFESYASLGTSAGFPIGPLRILAGSEALVGLILIGWTASYSYLVMQELWNTH